MRQVKGTEGKRAGKGNERMEGLTQYAVRRQNIKLGFNFPANMISWVEWGA